MDLAQDHESSATHTGKANIDEILFDMLNKWNKNKVICGCLRILDVCHIYAMTFCKMNQDKKNHSNQN